MIVSRAPLRLPLGGGGTDLPSYYRRHGGFILAAALDKYAYVCANRPGGDDLIRLKYSKAEEVERVADIRHDLALHAFETLGIERTSRSAPWPTCLRAPAWVPRDRRPRPVRCPARRTLAAEEAPVGSDQLGVRRRGGRLFINGSGGGAGHASRAVNPDCRKIAGIEACSPSDNVSELTARINDECWDTSYAKWLEGRRLSPDDLIMVFSVGGGDLQRRISANLVNCILYARDIGARVCGIVGRDGGATARLADACVVIPIVNESTITPHTEGLQAVVWHLLVSDSDLQGEATKWESVTTV